MSGIFLNNFIVDLVGADAKSAAHVLLQPPLDDVLGRRPQVMANPKPRCPLGRYESPPPIGHRLLDLAAFCRYRDYAKLHMQRSPFV